MARRAPARLLAAFAGRGWLDKGYDRFGPGRGVGVVMGVAMIVVVVVMGPLAVVVVMVVPMAMTGFSAALTHGFNSSRKHNGTKFKP